MKPVHVPLGALALVVIVICATASLAHCYERDETSEVEDDLEASAEATTPAPRRNNTKPRARAQQHQLHQNYQDQDPNLGPQVIRRVMQKAMSVSVPLFYDMVKNGSSLGINVLSGLVKVERGHEAERNGLMGSRPLSIRIFGIPVFERGQRVDKPESEPPLDDVPPEDDSSSSADP